VPALLNFGLAQPLDEKSARKNGDQSRRGVCRHKKMTTTVGPTINFWLMCKLFEGVRTVRKAEVAQSGR
jgi:hypothetical protein